jgi:hypothetical protein
MSTKHFKKIRLWIEDQDRPVIATYPAEESPIQPLETTPDFVRIRNVRGGDWVLPKVKILKARIEELNEDDREALDRALEVVSLRGTGTTVTL